ncbi:hypothetical protein [Streptomyces sp. NPDC059909]|uniref:hypothetical protein n=1 Tax=Streptomyces sp. NPDC059909 TaxID=3346998 RepID=UPI0036581FFE
MPDTTAEAVEPVETVETVESGETTEAAGTAEAARATGTARTTGTAEDSRGDPAADRKRKPAGDRKPAALRKPAPARRGPADPVKALMHRHRELCERAVDPLEIAAGLEAHGVTERTAVRFRHRDVFSLAEELYARVPRGEAGPRPAADSGAEARAGVRALTVRDVLPALLPGAVAVLAAVAFHFTSDGARIGVGAAGALGLLGALTYGLRRGPLRVAGRTVRFAGLWVGWLLADAVAGSGLLEQLVDGGPHGPWPVTPGPLVGLALAVAPAAWIAQLFSVQARRRLGTSRGLEEFAAGVRPVLVATITLYAAVLTAVLALTGLLVAVDLVPAVALGLLLFLARLLTVHGFPTSAATGVGAAAAVEVLALVTVVGGRLPGCAFLARPAEAAVEAWGSGSVPALACGTAALGLLVHATVALSRASAHST